MLSFIGPLLIGLLPLGLHVVDKLLDRMRVFGNEAIRKIIAEDNRPRVRVVAENKPVFEALIGYFEYQDDARIVVSLSLFNIVSLVFAQTECGGNTASWTIVLVLGVLPLALFVLTFLLKATNGSFEPAAVHSIRKWRRASFLLFALVMSIEVALRLAPTQLGCRASDGPPAGTTMSTRDRTPSVEGAAPSGGPTTGR